MSITGDTLYAPQVHPALGPARSLDQPYSWPVPETANIAELCCDRWARVQPARIAFTHIRADGAAIPYSYGRLHQGACSLAAHLRHRGIKKGDRIALLLPQGPEVLFAHFAAYRLGAVILPLFTLFGPDALFFRLKDSAARCLITFADQLDKLGDIIDQLDSLEELILCDERLPAQSWPGRGVSLFSDALAIPANTDDWPASGPADEPAMMIYTSGTTGPPKGTVHAHRFLIGHLPNIEISHSGLPQQGDTGWTPADWAWIGGLMDLALPCLYYGVRLVGMRFAKFDAGAAWQFIAAHRIRNMFLPPTALKMMRLHALEQGLPEGVNIRSIASGGEALPQTIIDWARETLNVSINEIYGQTECNLVICSDRAGGPVPPGAMGRAVPGHHVAVIDDRGQPVPDGQIGEIAIKAPDPVMFVGYWQQPEKTQEKFINGWLRTGDMGFCDRDGFFTFLARDDDVINSAGYRIGPSEIENCLMQHSRVQMAAVIGLPDELRGQIIAACIIPDSRKGLKALENILIKLIKDRLSLHLVPRRFIWCDQLPLTATGKIMRKTLRDELGNI